MLITTTQQIRSNDPIGNVQTRYAHVAPEIWLILGKRRREMLQKNKTASAGLDEVSQDLLYILLYEQSKLFFRVRRDSSRIGY